jgi:site-specific recombinase XerD
MYMGKRVQRVTPKCLNEVEIERLFSHVKDVRDRAILRLAYHRGLRASEVGLLQLSDYRADAGRLFVHRLKGSNSAEFPLLPVEQTSLRAWIRERGTVPGPIFPSRNRRPISRRRLDELMRHYGALANIPEDRRHMHVLKHSCGTHLYERTGDIVLVQDHLGHRDIRSTSIYIAMSTKKREELAVRLADWGRKKVA